MDKQPPFLAVLTNDVHQRFETEEGDKMLPQRGVLDATKGVERARHTFAENLPPAEDFFEGARGLLTDCQMNEHHLFVVAAPKLFQREVKATLVVNDGFAQRSEIGGWKGRARTCDHIVNSDVLYHLSYLPITRCAS